MNKKQLAVFVLLATSTFVLESIANDAAPAAKAVKAQVGKPSPGVAQSPEVRMVTDSAMPSRQDVSYAAGMHFGNQLKHSDYDFDIDEVAKAMKDILAGKAKMTDQEGQRIIQAWQTENRRAQLEGNKKKAQIFLADNAKKAGVKATASGLQYEVITEGTGKTPSSNDTVSVHYTGTLLNGTEFDSSRKRGQPAEFRVTGVIKGWTEALQLMKVGSRWKLYIAPELAYGEAGRPNIPPNSLLIFDVELLGIKEAPEQAAEQAVQAVSGEIIKVPSAEELSKGAKIEVLKEEDVKRLMATNNAAATNKATQPKAGNK